MNSPGEASPDAVALLEGWPLFDSWIERHGFSPYLRDYEVVVVAMAALRDGSGSYAQGRYHYLFSHCVEAHVHTSVKNESWRVSWEDTFIDYEEWERAGSPNGFVWGVRGMDAYAGAKYLPNSPLSAAWTERLAHRMHEVRIETNAHNLQLVFHGLTVLQTARGDVDSGDLTDIAPVVIGRFQAAPADGV